MSKLFIKALFLLFAVLPFTSVFSQISRDCVGTGCSAFNDKYGGLLDNFQANYMPQLTKDIFRAEVATHEASIPSVVTLNKFAIGWYGTLGITKPDKIAIFDPARGQYQKMNEFGFAPSHNFYAGINLGWTIAVWYNLYLDMFQCDFDSTKCSFDYQFPFLSRIEIYGNKMGSSKNSIDYNYIDTYYGNRKEMNNFGYMMRFQVIQEQRIFVDALKFSGFSIGAGYERSKVDFAKKINDINLGFQFGNMRYEWSGENVINYRSDVQTKLLDARTGFKFFDLIAIYLGTGISYSRGGVFFSLYRNGTYVTNNNPTSIMVQMKQNYFNNNYIQKYYTVGANISGFTIQGTSSYGKNSLDTKKSYSVLVGFTISY